MPITEDVWDHEVIGRERLQAQVNLLRRQITKRFGPPPAWVEEELVKRNHLQLEDLGVRLLDASGLAELFG